MRVTFVEKEASSTVATRTGSAPDTAMSQTSLFANDVPTKPVRPDIEQLRVRLDEIIAEAPQAATLWSVGTRLYYKRAVPSMADDLPDEEAARVKAAFWKALGAPC